MAVSRIGTTDEFWKICCQYVKNVRNKPEMTVMQFYLECFQPLVTGSCPIEWIRQNNFSLRTTNNSDTSINLSDYCQNNANIVIFYPPSMTIIEFYKGLCRISRTVNAGAGSCSFFIDIMNICNFSQLNCMETIRSNLKVLKLQTIYLISPTTYHAICTQSYFYWEIFSSFSSDIITKFLLIEGDLVDKGENARDISINVSAHASAWILQQIDNEARSNQIIVDSVHSGRRKLNQDIATALKKVTSLSVNDKNEDEEKGDPQKGDWNAKEEVILIVKPRIAVSRMGTTDLFWKICHDHVVNVLRKPEMTVTEFYETVFHPQVEEAKSCTIEWLHNHKDFALKTGEKKESFVNLYGRDANIFISYPRTTTVVELYSALQKIALSGGDKIFFIDILNVNNFYQPDYVETFRRTLIELKPQICFLVTPITYPEILTRSYCCWEFYCALRYNLPREFIPIQMKSEVNLVDSGSGMNNKARGILIDVSKGDGAASERILRLIDDEASRIIDWNLIPSNDLNKMKPWRKYLNREIARNLKRVVPQLGLELMEEEEIDEENKEEVTIVVKLPGQEVNSIVIGASYELITNYRTGQESWVIHPGSHGSQMRGLKGNSRKPLDPEAKTDTEPVSPVTESLPQSAVSEPAIAMIKALMDPRKQLNLSACECSNELVPGSWNNLFDFDSPKPLTSHCNPQEHENENALIIYLPLNAETNLKTLIVRLPGTDRPKAIKLFLPPDNLIEDIENGCDYVEKWEDFNPSRHCFCLELKEIKRVKSFTLAVDRQSSSTSTSLEYLNWSQQPASFFFPEKKEGKDKK